MQFCDNFNFCDNLNFRDNCNSVKLGLIGGIKIYYKNWGVGLHFIGKCHKLPINFSFGLELDVGLSCIRRDC